MDTSLMERERGSRCSYRHNNGDAICISPSKFASARGREGWREGEMEGGRIGDSI